MYKLTLSLPFTRTVTETDFILDLLASVDASWNCDKSDGVSSSSTSCNGICFRLSLYTS